MIELKQFCSDDPFRPYLHEPFTVDDFTYATNGHILVRVPKIDGVGPLKRDDPLNVEGTLKWHWKEGTEFYPCNLQIPAIEDSGVCPHCDGRGKEHNCPDCDCECSACDGTGKGHKKISAKVGGVDFDVYYRRQIAGLPGAEISHTADAGKNPVPMMFRFDGGVGSLMPLRKPFIEEIKVEIAA